MRVWFVGTNGVVRSSCGHRDNHFSLPRAMLPSACACNSETPLRPAGLKRSAKLSLAVGVDAPILRAVRRRDGSLDLPDDCLQLIDCAGRAGYDVHQQSRTKSEHECRFISVHATRLPRNGVGMNAKHPDTFWR